MVWNEQLNVSKSRFILMSLFLVNAHSCDGDQVSTETQNHLSCTPQQDIPSLRPLAAQVDYELQEALKECEDEMTALGISSHVDTWTAGDLGRCSALDLSGNYEKNEQTELAEVKNDFGTSSQKPVKFHGGCHGNEAHKNDSSAGEEGVFSFREYVLGKKQTNTFTAGAKDIKNSKEITESHSKETRQLSEAERQTNSEIETKIHTAESIADQQTTPSIWTGTQTTSEMDAAKETLTQDQSIQDICSSIYTLGVESTQDENKINVIAHTTQRQTGVIQELNPVIEEVVSSAKATQMVQDLNRMEIEMHSQLISDLLACQSPHTDKHAGHTLHLEAKISAQPNIQKQVESGTRQQISGQIETSTKVGSSLEHQRQELELPEQLSPEGKQLICSPPPEPEAHRAHFSLAEAPPTLIRHSPQGPEQHDDQDQTDGPYKSISEGETIHHNHCTTGEVKHEKNVSDASAVVIDFCQAKTAPEHEPEGRYDLETCPLEPENGPPLSSGAGALTALWGNSHSLSRVGAEKEEEESALEQASAESAASTSLQTTPTMPEMIESEGEKKRDDAFQSVAIIVQAAEREPAVLEADESPSSQGTLTEITAEQGQQCTSVIFPKIKCSPVQKEKATEESCGNKMPHNSTESAGKGGGLPIALSPAGNKDTGTVGTDDKALVTYSSPGVLGTCDWEAESYRSKKRKGESEEDGKETSEGGAQNAGRVSQTETATETCPSHRITASLAATQDESDLILPVTAGTAPFPRTINRINDCVSISPPPPLSHINSTETEAQKEEEANLNPSPIASGAELLGSDRSFAPAVSSENECLTAQANNQQVQSSSQTITTDCDTSIKTETQQQKQETTPTSEDTPQSTTLQVNMRDIAEICTKVEGRMSPKGMQSSFEDQKDTVLKGQMTECASLPPLMVFESLRHPVKETSFNFKGFLTINRLERENEKSSAKKELPAFEEGGKEERNGKQEEKVEHVEITYTESMDCRETTSTSQQQGETTVKLEENVNVDMGGCEESRKVTDDADVNKKNPVIFSSLSAAGVFNVSETKDAVNEILEEIEAIKENQECKESVNDIQISPNETDDSASTEKNSVLLQDVSLQEGCNSSPAVDGERADITVSEGVGQRQIEVLLDRKERLNEETDKSKGCGSPEAGYIDVTCPGNSKNLVNDSREQEKYTHEEESLVKTSSMIPTAASDTHRMCPCTQPDKKFNIEQPTTTSEMPLLSKAHKCADMLPYLTESLFSGEIMKSDAADPGDTTVPSLPAAETTVPAQSDLSSTTKQRTNSDARDVSVIVLKTPGPMLSHSESINDCDIAVAGTGEFCSVNFVCGSHTEIVKDNADKTNKQSQANEDMLRKQNADDLSYTVAVSAQEIAASSESLLFTTDRPEQAGCSPLVTKNSDIAGNAKIKENDASKGAVDFDCGENGKIEGHVNCNHENGLFNVLTNVTTDNEFIIKKDKSEGFKQVKGEEHNKECVKETKEKSSAKNETNASEEEGNEQKNGKPDERKDVERIQEEMAFREQKDSRIETNISEASCSYEMLHSQSTLKTQSPNDDIKCDSLLMQLQGNLDTLLTEEPAQHVSVDNVRINEDVSEGFMLVMGGEQNKECVKENERHDVKSVTKKDSKERTNTSEKQDKTAAKENIDQTQGENQTLINLFKLSGEEDLLNETIPRGKLQSSLVSEPGLTSKGIIEEALGCIGAPTEKSPPVTDQTNAFPKRDHTQDPRALSQTDLAFSQSQELQQQQKFMSAPEAVLSVCKSRGLENAETNNDADADANETEEKVMVYCSAEPQSSLNSTSESAILVGGNDNNAAVYNEYHQNEERSMQIIDLSGGNSLVCVESTSSEIQTQVAPNLSVLTLSDSETSEVKRVIEATEAKEPSISASHESVSKHVECTKSQTSVDEHGNVWDEILDNKKGSELPINNSSGFSVLPSLSHQEAGLKTNEKYFGSVTPEDIGITEIRPNSMSEVAQISSAGTSQLQQVKELVFQSSDGQLVTTSTASVLQKSIKEEKEISVDYASKDSVEFCAPNSTHQSETAVWRMEQLNKHLSEQFPVGTQNTEEQDTQCSEQQLMELHVRTCSDTENTISAMKAEGAVSNDRQQPEGIQEEIIKRIEDEEENKTFEKECIETSKRAASKSSESVVKEIISKENQSKLEEHYLSSPDEAIVCNVEQSVEVTDRTLTEMKKVMPLPCPETAVYLVTDPQDSLKSPLTVDQQSCQQPTKSFIQTLFETVTDTSKNSSTQNPDIADSHCGDIESLLTEKTMQKDCSESCDEEVSKVSEAADVLLGSGPGTVQVSQVKDSSDRQGSSVVFVPERTVNSSECSDWLRALKEAASMSQIIPEQRDETTCGATENRYFSN